MDIKAATFLDQKQLAIIQIRFAVENVALTFGRYVEPIPNNVDASGIEFGLFLIPNNRVKFKLGSHTPRGLLSQVNVKADDFALVIAETHRRVLIIKPDDVNFFGLWGVDVLRLVAATARSQDHQQEQ